MNDKNIVLKNQLAALILDCIEKDQKLPSEQEMMDSFSVSRFSLREALSVFEANGIITSQRGSGRFAKYPDLGTQIKNIWGMFIDSKPTLFLDFMEIRSYLELSAIPKVALTIRPEELLLLRKCINDMKQCSIVSREFSQADRNFHELLYRSQGNTLLKQLISVYWDVCDDSIIWPSIDPRETIQMHEDILSALASSDADRTVSALQAHFEDTKTQMTLALLNK